eukprot:358509-Chlamydomonas_euryale.AAC.4
MGMSNSIAGAGPGRRRMETLRVWPACPTPCELPRRAARLAPNLCVPHTLPAARGGLRRFRPQLVRAPRLKSCPGWLAQASLPTCACPTPSRSRSAAAPLGRGGALRVRGGFTPCGAQRGVHGHAAHASRDAHHPRVCPSIQKHLTRAQRSMSTCCMSTMSMHAMVHEQCRVRPAAVWLCSSLPIAVGREAALTGAAPPRDAHRGAQRFLRNGVVRGAVFPKKQRGEGHSCSQETAHVSSSLRCQAPSVAQCVGSLLTCSGLVCTPVPICSGHRKARNPTIQ